MAQPAQPAQPQQPPAEQPDKPDDSAAIQGEILPLDDLLNFAEIDPGDIESAAQWWDEHASAKWSGGLDG